MRYRNRLYLLLINLNPHRIFKLRALTYCVEIVPLSWGCSGERQAVEEEPVSKPTGDPGAEGGSPQPWTSQGAGYWGLPCHPRKGRGRDSKCGFPEATLRNCHSRVARQKARPLTIQEARSLKPRCQQGRAPSNDLGEGPSRLFQLSGQSQPSSASLSHGFCLFTRTLVTGPRAHPGHSTFL